MMSSDVVIAYYNPNKDIEVVVDASPVDLGSIFTQEDKVGPMQVVCLVYQSRVTARQRKKALAIV